MPQHVMTVVDAQVDPAREADLIEGFRKMVTDQKPDGFLESQLLKGQDGAWRIQTLWRDFDSLMTLRKGGTPPAAIALVESLGATHTHGAFSVQESYSV